MTTATSDQVLKWVELPGPVRVSRLLVFQTSASFQRWFLPFKINIFLYSSLIQRVDISVLKSASLSFKITGFI